MSLNIDIYHTTFLFSPLVVDVAGNFVRSTIQHIHVNLGPRIEGRIRDVAIAHHENLECQSDVFIGTRLNSPVELTDLVRYGFPAEEIDDWTEEELKFLADAYCPMRPEENLLRETIEREQEWTAVADDDFVERVERYMERYNRRQTEPDEFPPEFEDERVCPVCQEDEYHLPNYLLKLPCGHTLCKSCFKMLREDDTCPKCRSVIVRSLIKRKK
jgi:hypothetical protein